MKNLTVLLFLITPLIVCSKTKIIDDKYTINQIQEVINDIALSKLIFKNGTYKFKFSEKIIISRRNLTIEGENDVNFEYTKQINKHTSFFQIYNSSNITISNIKFKGNYFSCKNAIIILERNKNINIKNNSFEKFRNEDGACYVISLLAKNNKNIYINSNSFFDISSKGDNVVGTLKGMCGALYFYIDTLTSSDALLSECKIENNVIDSIYLLNNTESSDFDSDGIRIYVKNGVYEFNENKKYLIKIKDNHFKNFDKSAIKVQSFPNIQISDNILENRLNRSVFAGVRIYGTEKSSKNIEINNLKFFGNFDRAFIINGEKISIKNIDFTKSSISILCFQIGFQDETKNVFIKNISNCDNKISISQNTQNIVY